MSMLNREEKQRKIHELREALHQLEAELESEIQREQHEAIEHLDQHFVVVESKFQNLKTFWQALKSEWEEKRGGNS